MLIKNDNKHLKTAMKNTVLCALNPNGNKNQLPNDSMLDVNLVAKCLYSGWNKSKTKQKITQDTNDCTNLDCSKGKAKQNSEINI